MNSFSTRIIRTWEPAAWVEVLIVVLLLASAAILYIFNVQNAIINTSAKISYAMAMFSALSLSFLKPRNLGEIDISEDEVKIVFKNDILRFSTADIKEIGFNDRGYTGFWKSLLYTNKNHLHFMTSSGEKFDYEIAIVSLQKKEELSVFLNKLGSPGKFSENRKKM
ncbi:hypothetical protein [Salinimicrobium sp. GXAS 041]|uniref:hypothetical protein n=1 Tax=Salinimicrobium sp. GXAS 041 TaxID=3400806 RepID=UPI003C74D680